MVKSLTPFSLRMMCSKTSTDLAEMHKKFEVLTESAEDYLKSDPVLTDDMIIDNPFEILEKMDTYNFDDFEDMIEMDQRHKVELEVRNYPYHTDQSGITEHTRNIFQHPRAHPYRQVEAPQMLKLPKDEFQDNLIQRGKSFVGELLKPYDLRDEELIKITDRLKDKNEDKIQAIEDLKEIIPKLNHNLFPELLLFLAFDAKITDFTLWKKVIEPQAMEDFALYNFVQLNKIMYAITNVKTHDGELGFDARTEGPKETLKHKISGQILKEIDQANAYEFLIAMQCNRRNQHPDLHRKFLELMIEHKDKFLSEIPDENGQDIIHLVCNLLYCYFSNICRLKLRYDVSSF